jgi:hypothetical protein
MPDLLTFLLSDHRCPHCTRSLRWRWLRYQEVLRYSEARGEWRDEVLVCPGCQGWLRNEWHPAVLNDWLWGRWLAPGLAVWIISMLLGFHPVGMALGTLLLLAGLAGVLVYMVRARWRYPVYTAAGLTPDGQPPR